MLLIEITFLGLDIDRDVGDPLRSPQLTVKDKKKSTAE